MCFCPHCVTVLCLLLLFAASTTTSSTATTTSTTTTSTTPKRTTPTQRTSSTPAVRSTTTKPPWGKNCCRLRIYLSIYCIFISLYYSFITRMIAFDQLSVLCKRRRVSILCSTVLLVLAYLLCCYHKCIHA